MLNYDLIPNYKGMAEKFYTALRKIIKIYLCTNFTKYSLYA